MVVLLREVERAGSEKVVIKVGVLYRVDWHLGLTDSEKKKKMGRVLQLGRIIARRNLHGGVAFVPFHFSSSSSLKG